MSFKKIMTKPRYPWLWVWSMMALTVWYAWPQILYSSFILFDILRTFFPQSVPYLDPIIEWIKLERSSAVWWVK